MSPSSAREIFECYRTERRAQSYAGAKLEVLPYLSRHVAGIEGAQGMVLFADLKPELTGDVIDQQIAYFQQLHQDFEWKVYELDSPPTLKRMLEERGFRQGDEEAFLVLDTAAWPPPPPRDAGARIEKITDPDQLSDYAVAQRSIWPESVTSQVQQYAQELATNPDSISIYCAYVDDRPVGTGRVSFPIGSRFAELNGGGVVSEMRGRGIFSALLSRRIDEAKSRGYSWVAVDAAPMSRPILLRKGFQHVCWTYPMLFKAGA